MKVPVVLIGGFLGSGKTTLLKKLIANTGGRRIGVVRNEYVSSPQMFEVPLLMEENLDGLTFMEFPNACVCCAAKSEFIAAVNTMVRKKGPFDIVVIELSGLTDPITVADEFISSSDAVDDAVYFSKIVTVVDLANQAKDAHLAQRFIAASDLLILNKRSDVVVERVKDVREEIALLNPIAAVIETDFCETPSLEELIELTSQSARMFDGRAAPPSCHDAHCVQSHIVTVDRVYEEAELENLELSISKWLWGTEGSIWRGKGLLKLNNGKWCEIQICGESVFLSSPLELTNTSGSSTRLLIIGQDPDLEGLQLALQNQ